MDSIKIPTQAQKVTMRYEPCRCGCKGQDPWHSKRLVRNVHDVVLVDLDATDTTFYGVIATGTISHPSGDRRDVEAIGVYIENRGVKFCFWRAVGA